MRIFWISIVIALLLPLSALAQSFPDVPEGSKFYGAVEYLKENEVVRGYPDGTFKPDQTINRAEALKMAIISSPEAPVEDLSLTVFPDVNSSDWFYDYVQKGVRKQIVEGYEDGTFKPGSNINIAESMKIIFLSLGAEIGDPPPADPYPDVDQLAWYSAYAQYGKDHQILWPSGDGKIHAGRDITRGEFADILYRLLYTQEKELEKFPLSTHWPTFIHPTDEYLVRVPFEWHTIHADSQTIFWKRDEENEQLSWARVFPNSATVVMAVDKNEQGLSLDDYFDRVEYDSRSVIQSQILNDYPFKSVYMPDTTTFDYYFQLPNEKILVVYSQVGDGLHKPQLVEEIRNMVGTIRYHEGPAPSVIDASVTEGEKFLEQVRKNILVTGQAQAMLELFPDMVLIETDALGIGTGPVDYHYSELYNVTLKIERDSNTVLALSEDKSTAF